MSDTYTFSSTEQFRMEWQDSLHFTAIEKRRTCFVSGQSWISVFKLFLSAAQLSTRWTFVFEKVNSRLETLLHYFRFSMYRERVMAHHRDWSMKSRVLSLWSACFLLGFVLQSTWLNEWQQKKTSIDCEAITSTSEDRC